jgi:hypothetical protein
VSAAAVVRLDRERARSLTRELQAALDLAVDLVRQLWDGEAWRALGHASWEDFVAVELPQLAVIVRGMPKPEQKAKVAQLRAAGMSLRAVGTLTGLSPNTVKAHARDAGVQLAEVVSLDGAVRAASRAPAAPSRPRPLTVRLVELLAEAGPLDVREVCRRVRLPRERVSPALHRLASGRSPRLDYLPPERRGQFGRYAARTIGG